MSAQQKRPFYVFIAVSFVCLLVIASGVRSKALVDAVAETVESAVATAPLLSPLADEPRRTLAAGAQFETAPPVPPPVRVVEDTGRRTGARDDDRARDRGERSDRSRRVGRDDHPGRHRGQHDRSALTDRVNGRDALPPGLSDLVEHPGRHLGHSQGKGHGKAHGKGHLRGHGVAGHLHLKRIPGHGHPHGKAHPKGKSNGHGKAKGKGKGHRHH